MKKITSKLAAGAVACACLLGSASLASAADIKVKGDFEFGFGLYTGTNFTKHDNEETFDAMQSFTTQIDIIASESLRGVVRFEIGDTYWGNGGGATWGTANSGAGRGAGGAMGADGVSVMVESLYIDWLVPETDLQVRMGIQPFALPMAVARSDDEGGAYVIDDDLAGILLSYNFNENVGVNLGWFRPWDPYINGETDDNNNFYSHDEIDLFALTIPIEVQDSFSLTPYGMFAMVGDVDDDGFDRHTRPGVNEAQISDWLAGGNDLGHDGRAWWAGLAFELTEFDPFVAALDFTYGRYSADSFSGVDANGNQFTNDPDRSGWVAQAKFGYKLDYFTPILFGWYGSGAKDFDDNMAGTTNSGYRDGLMPVLSPDWGLTSFGWSNAHFGGREFLINDNPGGTWAVGLGLEDINFIENLTSHLRVAYFRGTSDAERYNEAVKHGLVADRTDAFREYGILDTSDWGMEVNLDNVINIYENLDMFVELAYVHVSLEHSPTDFEDNAWKGYVGFTYSF